MTKRVYKELVLILLQVRESDLKRLNPVPLEILITFLSYLIASDCISFDGCLLRNLYLRGRNEE